MVNWVTIMHSNKRVQGIMCMNLLDGGCSVHTTQPLWAEPCINFKYYRIYIQYLLSVEDMARAVVWSASPS